MTLPGTAADLPPPFVGQPLVFMVTLFSLLLVAMLTIEWLWRLGWSFVEQPAALKEPLTAQRLVLTLLLLAVLSRIGPDVVLMMVWHTESPAGRAAIYRIDAIMDSLAFAPFSLAWLVAYLTGPLIIHQLTKQPLPLHLWPSWVQMKRPAKIGAGVLAIAFALTYVR